MRLTDVMMSADWEPFGSLTTTSTSFADTFGFTFLVWARKRGVSKYSSDGAHMSR